MSCGYSIATSARSVSSSIERLSLPGTNVVATPTLSPGAAGTFAGRRMSGNASHFDWNIATPNQSGSVSSTNATKSSPESACENQ